MSKKFVTLDSVMNIDDIHEKALGGYYLRVREKKVQEECKKSYNTESSFCGNLCCDAG